MKKYIQVLAFLDPTYERGDVMDPIYQWGYATDEELSAGDLLELWRQERVAQGDMTEEDSQLAVKNIKLYYPLSVWTDFLEAYTRD